MASGELEVGDLCGVPAGVSFSPVQFDHLAQAGLEHETLLLALPQELLVLLGQRTHARARVKWV